MNRTCEHCAVVYDDAKCTTICPHGQFLSDLAIARKDAAFRLANKDVRLVIDPPNMRRQIQTIGWEGMVTLVGETTERSPFMLVEVE